MPSHWPAQTPGTLWYDATVSLQQPPPPPARRRYVGGRRIQFRAAPRIPHLQTAAKRPLAAPSRRHGVACMVRRPGAPPAQRRPAGLCMSFSGPGAACDGLDREPGPKTRFGTSRGLLGQRIQQICAHSSLSPTQPQRVRIALGKQQGHSPAGPAHAHLPCTPSPPVHRPPSPCDPAVASAPSQSCAGSRPDRPRGARAGSGAPSAPPPGPPA